MKALKSVKFFRSCWCEDDVDDIFAVLFGGLAVMMVVVREVGLLFLLLVLSAMTRLVGRGLWLFCSKV